MKKYKNLIVFSFALMVICICLISCGETKGRLDDVNSDMTKTNGEYSIREVQDPENIDEIMPILEDTVAIIIREMAMSSDGWENFAVSQDLIKKYTSKKGLLNKNDIVDIYIKNNDFMNKVVELEVLFDNRTTEKYKVKWQINNNKELDDVVVEKETVDISKIETYAKPVLKNKKEVVEDESNAIRLGRKIGADETMPTFETVPNNKVSIIENLASRVNEISLAKEYARETNINEMDTVIFGSYPQSDITGNTKEPIEWIVLEKNDSHALLLSKYILDCKPYKDRKSTSGNTINKWLNSEFYNNAFSRDEQNIILTNVSDKGNSDVFFLTVDDLEDYFNIKNSKSSFINECLATCGTEYAKSIDNNNEKLSIRNSDIVKNLNGNSPWWTQSKGDSADKIVTVSGDGTYLYSGTSKIYNRIGVRPAIWITLKKH